MNTDILVRMKQEMFERGNIKEVNRINKMINLRARQQRAMNKLNKPVLTI